jgi:hypothetical protein
MSMRRRQTTAMRAVLGFLPILGLLPATAAANPINILFVGNSFTHGRYEPVRTYNGGFAAGDVHDLLCPSPASCSSAEQGTQINPGVTPPPGSTLLQQLDYLEANPSAQYNEPGPYGGVPGIFLQFTREAGLDYSVSVVAVSSATLTGYLNNTGSEAGDLPLIESSAWNKVVLQDQSFRPLPSTITVNGHSVATRGDPAGFESAVTGLINGIDAADKAAGKPNAAVTLYETQPLASYGYTSSNPNAPIFGSSTSLPGGLNAPYVGDANPIAAMASDLHNAYEKAASDYMASNPTGSSVNVALAGDAWVSAIDAGIAVQDPYLATNPPNEVDLWDSNALDACCTTPIGYHPSVYGAYLSALVLFDEITGVSPQSLLPEFDPNNPGYDDSAAYELGISPEIARELAMIAGETVRVGHPIPEPGSLVLLSGIVGIFVARKRPRRRSAGPRQS